jgi:hypothetical protein
MKPWRKPSRDTLERVSKALFVVGVSLGSAALVVGPGLLAAREHQMMAKSSAPDASVAIQTVSAPLTLLLAGSSLRQPALEIKLPVPKPALKKPVAIAPEIKTMARAERSRPAPKLEQATPTSQPVLVRQPVRQPVNANAAARTNARASARQVRIAPSSVKPARSVSRARSVAASSVTRSSRAAQITRITTRQPINTVAPKAQSVPQPLQAVIPERATPSSVIADQLENTMTETQPSDKANPATMQGRLNEPDSPAERLADRIFER